MPNLPPVSVTDAQYSYLVEMFTQIAEERGQSDPVKVYVDTVNAALVALARRRAIAAAEARLSVEMQTAIAAIDARLASLLST